jgi:hypothetical protein
MLPFMSNLTKKKKKQMNQLRTPGHRLLKMWPLRKPHRNVSLKNDIFFKLNSSFYQS